MSRVEGFGLPADGSLLFFLNHEQAAATGERRYGRVVYVPAGTDTELAAGSTDHAFVGEQYDVGATLRAEFPDWFGPDEDDEDEDEDDLSPFQQQLARDLARDLPHLDELRALANDLWPPDNGYASAYLGGYADAEVIKSFAEQTLAWREKNGEVVIPVGKWYSHVERETHRLTTEWVSLARFPVDNESYYRSDGSFVIRHDDLAAGRLDEALSVAELIPQNTGAGNGNDPRCRRCRCQVLRSAIADERAAEHLDIQGVASRVRRATLTGLGARRARGARRGLLGSARRE